MGAMNLAQLIEHRKPQAGSLRDMAERATRAGHPISHPSISAYATEKVREVPSESTRKALAAALDVPIEVVTAAAFETAAPGLRDSWPEGFGRAQLFIHKTEGRSDAEVAEVLRVVEAALAMLDASRNHASLSTRDTSDAPGNAEPDSHDE